MSLIIIAIVAMLSMIRGCTVSPLFEEPQSTPVYLEDDDSSIEGEEQKNEKRYLKSLRNNSLS